MQAPFQFLPSQPRVIGVLRAAGAVSASSALKLDPLGRREQRQLECLLENGIVKQASSGGYYLIEEAWLRRRSEQQRRIFVGSTVIIGAIVLVLVLVRMWR